jgi:hypothetical protein
MQVLIRTLGPFLTALAAAVACGFVVGYIAVLVMPCSWFGSSFEGACGYGGLLASVAIGILVAAAVFTAILFKLLSRTQPVAGIPFASKRFALGWCILLALQYIAGFLLELASLGALIDVPVLVFLSLAFLIASAVLAKQSGKHAAIALLALIPIVGPAAIAFLLFKPVSNAIRGA